MSFNLNTTMLICHQKSLEIKLLSNANRVDKQQGSTIVLALFVIIVLTLLGGVLMKMISTSSEAVSQEVLGTRAYMAANSAMQAQLQKLFPLNTTGSCSGEHYDLQISSTQDIAGLYDCEADTICDPLYTDAINGVEYYRLTSTGKCGSGTMTSDSKTVVKSSRTIQVEARSL